MIKGQHVSTLFVALIAGVGMFLSTLDSGIINVAIPSFIQIFHTKLAVTDTKEKVLIDRVKELKDYDRLIPN